MSCNKQLIKNEIKNIHSNILISYTHNYISEEIEKLKTNISCIYFNKTIPYSYQDLYITTENLCTLNQTDCIFKDLHFINTEYLNIRLLDLLQFDGTSFLQKLKELWLLYCHKSRIIKNIYLFMEVAIVKEAKRKISIWQMCMDKFYEIVLAHPSIKEKLSFLYTLIEMERNLLAIDTKLIIDIILMLDKLSLYETYFEQQFIQTTQEYYTKNRDLLIDGSVVEYFYFVQEKFNEEEKRIDNYLKSSSKAKINKILYKILIEDKLSLLMTKLEAANIFEKADLYDIITIYDLLRLLPKGNEDLCGIFSKFIINKGTECIFELKNEVSLIGDLLDFKDGIDDIVKLCFRNNTLYAETVRACFKKFINQRKYKPAQFLAKYIDSKMRDKQIPEDLLDKIMVLFRFIQGKDVFEAYYKRYLSKRLLLGKSSSQDAEKYMISKLKLECGDGFTSKLEGMFRDIDLSQSLTSNFKQRFATSNLLIEFTAHVLTSSFWPTFTKYPVTLSDKMLYYQTIFHDFYKSKYSGRSLQWIPNLGHCLVKASFKTTNKELQVSLFQALVLLLFNDTDTITLKNIKLFLNLDDRELNRTILSLLNNKTKILVKNPAGNALNDDDELSINENFTNKLFRIKINQLQYKETEEEQKITEEEVLHDRHLQIDAALVRLMKQHQKMRHNDLISMIYNVLKFPVNPNDIKKRIEILIERDFLARNPDDTNSYLYVA